MKREQPGLGPTVAFLYTRVSTSDDANWKKLRCLIVFVKGTTNKKHIIGTTGITDTWTWVDTVYAVHEDM